MAKIVNNFPNAVSLWAARERAGEEPLSESECAELARLRRENVELRMERDVLKRLIALCVKEATSGGPVLVLASSRRDGSGI